MFLDLHPNNFYNPIKIYHNDSVHTYHPSTIYCISAGENSLYLIISLQQI